MTKRTCALAAVLIAEGWLGNSREARAEGPPTATQIVVKMESCDVTRTRLPKGVWEAMSGGGKDQLIKRGVAMIQGRKYTFYLPKAKMYTVKNINKMDDDSENMSTQLTIVQGDGTKFTALDSWYANMPVRLGDSMFDIVSIAPDGGLLELKPSLAPLRGVLIGRTCPPFSFKTAEGATVSREAFAGKAFLIDVWSVT